MSKLTVTLDHIDLINLAEFIHRQNPGNNIGPAYIEYCICDFIRKQKGADFFKEEQKEIDEYEKS